MAELRVTVPDDIAARFATEAQERGTSTENVVAEVLSLHAPADRDRPLAFIGLFEAPDGTISVAEAEQRLENGLDNGFARVRPTVSPCALSFRGSFTLTRREIPYRH
jgi:hypothetical protein